MELTKKADYVICMIYYNYLEKLRNGVEADNAILNYPSDLVQESLVPDLSLSEVDFAMGELGDKGLLSCDCRDDLAAYTASLTSQGVLYMENRFGKSGIKILDFVSKTLGIILPLLAHLKLNN